MYMLTKNELLALRGTDGGLESNLASAALSGFIASLITLLTVQLSPVVHAAFFAAAITTGFLTVCFGVIAVTTKRRADREFANFVECEPGQKVQTIYRRPGA